MHRLISMYSKNRLKVWAIIIMIILGLSLIQVLNKSAKNKEKETQIEKSENIVKSSNSEDDQEKDYQKESNTLTSTSEISEKYQEKFGKIIDEFYTACIENDIEKAYGLLSDECKNLMYQNQDLFESLYCREKFSNNKEYSFQSWATGRNTYIYQVKIFDNMLSTGKSSDQGYIEDYVTLVPDEDSFKLNVNSFIETKVIGEKSANGILTIQADSKEIYKDYEIYKFKIKNNTQDRILLDTGKKTDTMYVVDDIKNRYKAFSYEKSKTELLIKPDETKVIEIKYDRAFNSKRSVEKIVFSNIVKYEEYLANQDATGETIYINIDN